MGSKQFKAEIKHQISLEQSKDPRKWDSFNIQMTQNVLLIWLDASIDESTDDCQTTISHFRQIVNNIVIFTDGEECIQFLQDMAHEKACMIISDSLGQEIVPRIHDLPQIDSIFILCDNENDHRKCANQWPKIKNVCAEIECLSEAVKQATDQCEQNAISISILTSDGSEQKKIGDQLDPSFMYTRIMKEVFLTIDFDQNHMDSFIQYCRMVLADNPKQLQYVEELAQQYNEHTPIWWYTRDCFLYPMLNRALRVMDVDLLMKLGFFIRDLHHHLEQLHDEQFGDNESHRKITLYRGQGLEMEVFEKIVANKGGLMSFNSFLSISKDYSVSLQFAQRTLKNLQMVGVLFSMAINPALCSIPFASIGPVGYFEAKEEAVLFSMHTVFRIGEITPVDGNPRLLKIQLTLVSDQDNDLHDLVDYMRKETFPNQKSWYRLGALLEKVGQSNQAQALYNELLDRAIDNNQKAKIYHAIGSVKDALGKYTESIDFYKKALAIDGKNLPSNHLSLATSYNNIGRVYHHMGQYSQALSSHKKALTIREKTLPSNHPSLANSYSNIALMYDNMGDYAQALFFLQKALEIDENTLPSNHPHLATSYNNIALAYNHMGEYSAALSSHQKAVAIYETNLPSDHPHLATSYNNIALVHDSMGEYSQALFFLQKALKALAIDEQSLPSNHPSLATSYNNIALVYDHMGEYSQAVSFLQKAVAIIENILPSDHPHLATSYNNIALVYDNMNEYAQALPFLQKALGIYEKILPSNHLSLTTSYDDIGKIYFHMQEYDKALSYYERALQIGQMALCANHPKLAWYLKDIGMVYEKKGDYVQALSFHKRALEVGECALSASHPHLQLYRESMERIANIKKDSISSEYTD